MRKKLKKIFFWGIDIAKEFLYNIICMIIFRAKRRSIHAH